MFVGPFGYSIVKRAVEKKLVEINLINIRDFGIGKHKIVDDTPYGGGIGMVMRPDVLLSAINQARSSFRQSKGRSQKEYVVLLSAGGEKYNQSTAKKFAQFDHLIIICGHYEGVDQRITKHIDSEISIGDFITTGGEIPAILITDSVVRLISGIFKPGVTENESFSFEEKGNKLLEYPHYTKPTVFENIPVPEILLTGNHQKISKWRLNQAIKRTKKNRPDLLNKNKKASKNTL